MKNDPRRSGLHPFKFEIAPFVFALVIAMCGCGALLPMSEPTPRARVEVEAAWTVKPNDRMYEIVGTDEVIYAAVSTGGCQFRGSMCVVALDAKTGTRIWTFARQEILATPTLIGDTLYVVAQKPGNQLGGRIHAVNTSDGSLKWTSDVGEAPMASVGDVLFVLNQQYSGTTIAKQIIALDANTGDELHREEIGAGTLEVALAPAAGKLIAFNSGAEISATDARTFSPAWRATLKPFAGARDHMPVPIVEDGAVYAVAGDVAAFDLATGRQLWSMDLEGEGAALSLAQGMVFTGRADGPLLALDAKTGALRWKFDSPAGKVLQLPAAFADGVLFVRFEGGLCALDATTGALKWTTNTGVTYTAPPVIARGMAFMLNTERPGNSDDAPGTSLTAFDTTTGEVRYVAKRDISPFKSLTRIGDRVYVIENNVLLHALGK